jgi:Rieske Fe-S protein
MLFYRTSLFLFLSVGMIALLGCNTESRNRPFGVVQVAMLADLQGSEIFLPKEALYVRQDAQGYSVMSTLCTHDLSLLRLEVREGRQVFVSDFSESVYSKEGDVLHGPAKKPLPYFELVLDRATYSGPLDTLYARIGVEKPRSWRLAIQK